MAIKYLTISRSSTWNNETCLPSHILRILNLNATNLPWSINKIKLVIFWDIAPCSPYMNRCFGGTYHRHLQGRKSAEQETSESSSFLLGWYWTLKMEVIRSSETSVHIRSTRRYIPEDGNFHFHNYRCRTSNPTYYKEVVQLREE
jgi:hypothetical protein